MEILLVIIIILLILSKIKFKPNNTHRYQKKTDVPGEENNAETNYEASNYQRKWMFTYNEKDIYKQLKSIAHQNGLELFAKVRLLDLVEPKSSVKNNKGYLWKIQAKHVDFVICDQKLVARYIIELDDNSHDTEQRKERDRFVDEVLQATGYKVLHIRAFDETTINQFLGVSEPKVQD